MRNNGLEEAQAGIKIARRNITNLRFPGGSEVKASASNAGDPGSIPGLGRSPGEEMAAQFSTFAWKIPWMEEPDKLQSMGSQRVGHD